MDQIASFLRDQSGVISRAQVLGAGITRTALARMLRRGELVLRHPGVYLDHNGPPTWLQRAWVAVLAAGPGAALCLDSAQRAHEGPGRRERDDDGPIHVAVDRGRHVATPDGVVLHRMAGLKDRVQWNLRPPRTAYDDTVIDRAAAARNDHDAVAVLADACGSRRTTAARLLECLAKRSRVARRAWLLAVLSDVAEGTCSVLEHGYLNRVVRPHGLPVGTMQAARVTAGGSVLRDVEHTDFATIVELNGRLFHSSKEAWDADLDRELDALAESDQSTIKLGYSQVFRQACRTAARLEVIFRRRGWDGHLVRCPDCGGSDQAG